MSTNLLLAWSVGSLAVVVGAILLRTSWMMWHRVRGRHVDWWWSGPGVISVIPAREQHSSA